MPNVIVKGKGKVVLAKNDFVAAGGEGSVYSKGGTAYKIYSDPSKMIPEGKINELQVITEPNIIKPMDIILDSKNNHIGYTMRYVTDTYALCQLFNKVFKQRNSLTTQQIFDLIVKMQNGIKHIHDKGILIVDCNEMNFLINQTFDEVYFIDVDSYQTPTYKATVLMESIRDRHCKNNQFTKGTDWFSWAIVTFQMFIGIHPYKGKHKTVNGLDERMLKNLSVFNKDVGIPSICESFDVIPQAYRDWYKALFEEGKRIEPPSAGVAKITIITKADKIVGSNKFEIKELFDFPSDLVGDITNVIFSFGSRIVQGERGAVLGTKIDSKVLPNLNVGFTPHLNHCFAVRRDPSEVACYDVTTGKATHLPATVNKLMSYDSRVYAIDNENVYEIIFIELPNNIKFAMKQVANIVSKATSVFDGVLIQNLLEATYVSIFPKTGSHYQVRMKELEGYRIVDARFDRGVLMAIGVKNGKYDRFVFRFDNEYSSYDAAVVQDISPMGLNFTVIDTGICVHIDEEECVNVFQAIKDGKRVPSIKDPAISSDMQLYRWGGQAVVSRGEKLYSFKMK